MSAIKSYFAEAKKDYAAIIAAYAVSHILLGSRLKEDVVKLAVSAWKYLWVWPLSLLIALLAVVQVFIGFLAGGPKGAKAVYEYLF